MLIVDVVRRSVFQFAAAAISSSIFPSTTRSIDEGL
jgi:hypothetical protein